MLISGTGSNMLALLDSCARGDIEGEVVTVLSDQPEAAGLAKDGVRVNAIAPGSIEFPGGMWEERKTTDPKLYGRILASIPFGRYGTPEEVANAALFLASPLAGWITGQTIVVDGGQTLS